jgi:hypothetical protein
VIRNHTRGTPTRCARCHLRWCGRDTAPVAPQHPPYSLRTSRGRVLRHICTDLWSRRLVMPSCALGMRDPVGSHHHMSSHLSSWLLTITVTAAAHSAMANPSSLLNDGPSLDSPRVPQSARGYGRAPMETRQNSPPRHARWKLVPFLQNQNARDARVRTLRLRVCPYRHRSHAGSNLNSTLTTHDGS